MTKKLKWRLSEKPTPESVIDLLNSGVITKDEAKDILFSEETEATRDADSLKAEIKFLRELVERLSKNQPSTIIETIRYVEKPYYKQPWYEPYKYYCSTGNSLLAISGTATTGVNAIGQLNAQSNSLSTQAVNTANFTDLKTF